MEVELKPAAPKSGGGGLVRWTLGSALAWGSAFLTTSLAGALIAGVRPLEHLGPVGALTVVGFTVGGLVGPLARGIAGRRQRR